MKLDPNMLGIFLMLYPACRTPFFSSRCFGPNACSPEPKPRKLHTPSCLSRQASSFHQGITPLEAQSTKGVAKRAENPAVTGTSTISIKPSVKNSVFLPGPDASPLRGSEASVVLRPSNLKWNAPGSESVQLLSPTDLSQSQQYFEPVC